MKHYLVFKAKNVEGDLLTLGRARVLLEKLEKENNENYVIAVLDEK